MPSQESLNSLLVYIFIYISPTRQFVPACWVDDWVYVTAGRIVSVLYCTKWVLYLLRPSQNTYIDYVFYFWKNLCSNTSVGQRPSSVGVQSLIEPHPHQEVTGWSKLPLILLIPPSLCCLNVTQTSNYIKKIPHTGDKESLDRCG